MTDQIEHTITVSARPDRVWAALTTEEGMSAWFGNIAVIDLKPGWAADADTRVEDGPSTLVEFLVDPDDNDTRITVVEGGFASFPEDVRDKHLQENTTGWESELDQLAAYLTSGVG